VLSRIVLGGTLEPEGKATVDYRDGDLSIDVEAAGAAEAQPPRRRRRLR
jgi:hypothetical protein